MSDYTPISLIRGNSTVIDETSIVDGQILFDESRKCLFMDDGDTRSKYSGLGADSNVATVEDTTTSTHAYAKGDYVVVEGQLYEVTAAIAIGDTFTVGTNIAQTTVGDELVQIKSDLSGTKQPIGTITLTLATGNGTKTVAQLMNEGFATLTAYRPSTNGATHFRIESFDAPIGGSGVIKKLISLDRNIVSAFTDVLVDASAVAPRADGIYGFGARIQSTGSMLKRIGVSTTSVASYVDWSTNTVDNNIKFTVLITLYKSFQF